MRFYAFVVVAASFTAVHTAPLPDGGPWGIRKWIKINNVEYEVPMHLSPEEFRQNMLSVRSDRFQNINLQTFPRPTPTSPDSQWALLSGFQQQQRYTYPITVSSRPLGRYSSPPTGIDTNSHAGFIPNGRSSVVNLPQPPITPLRTPQMSYPQPPSMYSRSQQNTGSRQWVKLAEGRTPIEVPMGRNPQEFLNSMRSTPSGFRYLSGKHAANVKHILPPPPAPPVAKVAYEIRPTKTAVVMPQPPSKKGMIMPAPPPVSKGAAYIPQINVVHTVFAPVMLPVAPPAPPPTKLAVPKKKKRIALMPTKQSFTRPMYVAAGPVGKKW